MYKPFSAFGEILSVPGVGRKDSRLEHYPLRERRRRGARVVSEVAEPEIVFQVVVQKLGGFGEIIDRLVPVFGKIRLDRTHLGRDDGETGGESVAQLPSV